jgi:hypothetical protein
VQRREALGRRACLFGLWLAVQRKLLWRESCCSKSNYLTTWLAGQLYVEELSEMQVQSVDSTVTRCPPQAAVYRKLLWRESCCPPQMLRRTSTIRESALEKPKEKPSRLFHLGCLF